MNNRQARGRGRGRNNNRNNNNRGGGGIDRDNRIDNRARGNSAQMLDKFKKMAQDSQVNGDRVQAEYYHQFADHYFRVNADMQARREEQRLAREEARGEQRTNGHDQDTGDGDDDNRSRPQRGRGRRDSQDDQAKASEGPSEASEEKKPVRSRRPRKAANGSADKDEAESSGLDASALPPAISAGSDEVEVEKKPARKRRAVKPKSDDDSAQESDAA